MRIAMLGVTLSSQSRATNIARVMTLFDVAAGEDPASDVIVIPTGPGVTRNTNSPPTEAMIETYRASVAAKAKEWGLTVVMAQHVIRGDMPITRLSVLDADGDTTAERMCNTVASDADDMVLWAESVVGRIGVYVCRDGATVDVEGVNRDARPAWLVVLGDVRADGQVAVNADDDQWQSWADRNETPVCTIRAADETTGRDAEMFVCRGRLRKKGVPPAGVVAFAEITTEGSDDPRVGA